VNQSFRLRPGLNVISGESGSGKSVLLAVFNQVLGMAASDDMVRAPATCAVVEAAFELGPAASGTISKLLRELGLPRSAVPQHGGGQVHIRREISFVDAQPSGASQRSALSQSVAAGDSHERSDASHCVVTACEQPNAKLTFTRKVPRAPSAAGAS